MAEKPPDYIMSFEEYNARMTDMFAGRTAFTLDEIDFILSHEARITQLMVGDRIEIQTNDDRPDEPTNSGCE